jgi:hypothetical protein
MAHNHSEWPSASVTGCYNLARSLTAQPDTNCLTCLAGSNNAFDSLASALTQHGEGLQGDLDAIAAAAKQLQPLLQKAQQLKAGISTSSKDTNGEQVMQNHGKDTSP